MESDDVIYGLLGRVHILMRRVTGRVTDVEYMKVNKPYAREIVRLGQEAGNDELESVTSRLWDAMDLGELSEAELNAAGSADVAEAGRRLLERMRNASLGSV